jgi:hypothetical protein
MNNRIAVLLRITRLVCLSCLVTMGWFLLEPGGSLAYQPPPPPNTPTAVPTPTATSRPTDTPIATETAVPTNTPMPTDTAIPTPEDTSTPLPTPTQVASATPTSEQPPPAGPTQTPEPEGQGGSPVPNLGNCQSVVEGYVLDGSGQRSQGATVLAEAEGWSGATATNDEGLFGFAGLCAGTTTLQAFLPSGQASAAVSIDLTGQNSVKVDLSAGIQATATAPAADTEQQVSEEPVTAEAGMPLTGFSGWLFAGAIILGVLMLLTAGARRVLNVHEPSED